MPASEPQQTPVEPTELLLRYSRQSLASVVTLVTVAGAALIAGALGVLPQVPQALPALIAFGIIVLAVGLRSSAGGRRWSPKSPVTQAVLQDEFRQANIARAERGALFAVLLGQVPLAVLLRSVPGAQAVFDMAIGTLCLGVAAFLALFLFFDREQRHG